MKRWLGDQIECDCNTDETEKSQDVDKGQDGKFMIIEKRNNRKLSAFTLNGEIISKKYER